jgi:hypothetical protein
MAVAAAAAEADATTAVDAEADAGATAAVDAEADAGPTAAVDAEADAGATVVAAVDAEADADAGATAVVAASDISLVFFRISVKSSQICYNIMKSVGFTNFSENLHKFGAGHRARIGVGHQVQNFGRARRCPESGLSGDLPAIFCRALVEMLLLSSRYSGQVAALPLYTINSAYTLAYHRDC